MTQSFQPPSENHRKPSFRPASAPHRWSARSSFVPEEPDELDDIADMWRRFGLVERCCRAGERGSKHPVVGGGENPGSLRLLHFCLV